MAGDRSTTCSEIYRQGDRRTERRAGSTAAPGRTIASGRAASGRLLLNKRRAESGRRSAGACRGALRYEGLLCAGTNRLRPTSIARIAGVAVRSRARFAAHFPLADAVCLEPMQFSQCLFKSALTGTRVPTKTASPSKYLRVAVNNRMSLWLGASSKRCSLAGFQYGLTARALSREDPAIQSQHHAESVTAGASSAPARS